jgi:hypothetical protein
MAQVEKTRLASYRRNECALQFLRLPKRTHLPHKHTSRHPTKISQRANSEDKAIPLLAQRHGRHREVDIAHTIACPYFEQSRLAASFFSTGGGDVGNASNFVPTVAVQPAAHAPLVQRHICEAITERSITASQSLVDQWR